MVAARRQEQGVSGRAPARYVADLRDDIEAEHVDVEGADAIDVRGAQVDVTKANAWVDRRCSGFLGNVGTLGAHQSTPPVGSCGNRSAVALLEGLRAVGCAEAFRSSRRW